MTYDHYRYIRYADGTEELYDLESDPNEWMNRADDAEMADIKADLIARLPKYDAPDARGGDTTGN